MATQFKTKYNYDPSKSWTAISGEPHTIPATSPIQIFLKHIPKQGTLTISGASTTWTEVTDRNPSAVGEYRVYWDEARGRIEFYSGDGGKQISVSYTVIGTVVWAEDVNTIQDVINNIENSYFSKSGGLITGAITLQYGDGSHQGLGRIYGGTDNNDYIEIDGTTEDYIQFVINGNEKAKILSNGMFVTGSIYEGGTALGSKYAAISHTHTESEITDLGNYALSSHTHPGSDITSAVANAIDSDTVDGIHGTSLMKKLADSSLTMNSYDINSIGSAVFSDTAVGNETNTDGRLIYDQTVGLQIYNTYQGSWGTIWDDFNVPSTATRWPSWNEVTNKPSTFSPSSHTHTESEITDFGSYLSTSGGTVNGTVTINSNLYADRYFQKVHGNPRSNAGTPTITEMALFDSQFTNKTWFYNPTKITFEYFDGTSWIDLAPSTTEIKKFVSGNNNSGIVIPNLSEKFRITVNNDGHYVYLNALYMYWSTNSHSSQVHIYKRAYGSTTWEQVTNSTESPSAWPGHLYLPFDKIPFHSSRHYDAVRIEFIPSWSEHETYSSADINLRGMEIWGGYPAGSRTIYSHDEDKNVTFPAELMASTFKNSSGIEVSYSGHLHDSRYYTEAEVNNLLAGKSDTGHTHDSRYYTESEINTKLAGKSNTGHTHSYLPLSGGTIRGDVKVYAKSNNQDVDFRIGDRDGSYGFTFTYKGTNGGDDNSLELWADNQNGTALKAWEVKQDGTTYYKGWKLPKIAVQSYAPSNPSNGDIWVDI